MYDKNSGRAPVAHAGPERRGSRPMPDAHPSSPEQKQRWVSSTWPAASGPRAEVATIERASSMFGARTSSKTRAIKLALAHLALFGSLSLCACAVSATDGGGAAPPSSKGPSGQSGSGGSASDLPTTPTISGFDLDPKQGGWWEFRYSYDWAGAYPEHHETTFLLKLGAPMTVGNDTAFPVKLSVLQSDGSSASTPTWEWSYLSFTGNRIRASKGGAFEPLFDAVTGRWPATSEGLFNNLRQGGFLEAVSDGANWKAQMSKNDSGCEVIPGYGSVCTDTPTFYLGYDLFRAGVGPAGSYFQGCSGGCLTYHYDLIDASLDGKKPIPEVCPTGDGLYCGGNGVGGDPDTLYDCAAGKLTVNQVCGITCKAAPAGQLDECAPCPDGNGEYCGGHGIPGDAHKIYECTNGALSVLSPCSTCLWEPSGTPDQCLAGA